MHDFFYAGSVGKGWLPLVLRCIEVTKKYGGSIAQVKEKFGGLRFYVDFPEGVAAEEAHKVIGDAESESYTLCERCGAPGSTKGSVYWLVCLCETCRPVYKDAEWSYVKVHSNGDYEIVEG